MMNKGAFCFIIVVISFTIADITIEKKYDTNYALSYASIFEFDDESAKRAYIIMTTSGVKVRKSSSYDVLLQFMKPGEGPTKNLTTFNSVPLGDMYGPGEKPFDLFCSSSFCYVNMQSKIAKIDLLDDKTVSQKPGGGHMFIVSETDWVFFSHQRNNYFQLTQIDFDGDNKDGYGIMTKKMSGSTYIQSTYLPINNRFVYTFTENHLIFTDVTRRSLNSTANQVGSYHPRQWQELAGGEGFHVGIGFASEQLTPTGSVFLLLFDVSDETKYRSVEEIVWDGTVKNTKIQVVPNSEHVLLFSNYTGALSLFHVKTAFSQILNTMVNTGIIGDELITIGSSETDGIILISRKAISTINFDGLSDAPCATSCSNGCDRKLNGGKCKGCSDKAIDLKGGLCRIKRMNNYKSYLNTLNSITILGVTIGMLWFYVILGVLGVCVAITAISICWCILCRRKKSETYPGSYQT